jgi:hypothetical protein
MCNTGHGDWRALVNDGRAHKEGSMHTTFIRTTLALLLAGGLGSQATLAKARKHSPAHAAAVQQCRDTYQAAAAVVHAPNGPRGNARKRAMHAAAQQRKRCVATAPQ